MKLKTKFHLTLVILITIANAIIGFPGVSDIAKANALDIKNQAVYNKNISNIYNDINIKYISIKLYNKYVNKDIQKTKLSNSLGFKEKVEIVMYSIKQVESHGRYKAKSKYSDACGAYQYMPITWNNYKGFKNACLAPTWAQDARMRGEVKYLWKKYGDWEKVIAGHYMPAYAGNKAKWNTVYFKGQPTIREYVQTVQIRMNSILVGLATT